MTDDRNQRIARALGWTRCTNDFHPMRGMEWRHPDWPNGYDRCVLALPDFDTPEGLALGKAEAARRGWDWDVKYMAEYQAFDSEIRLAYPDGSVERLGYSWACPSEAAAFWDAFLAAVEASEEGTE